ncbi:alpha/beta fold hydrolase, partial [Pseudonocardia spinosispora]|uniref:alpha/beta fold hydrolase n=1 Tax=Pseudonocardia spinosispora TaxID=103441 RepID=UPI000560ED1A
MDSVVFGATGFIGRWTVLQLLERGRTVAAVVRDPARGAELRAWLHDHGADVERFGTVTGDVTLGAGLGLSAADEERLASVRDVVNAAGFYRFGLRREEARAVNVDGALAVLRWAATRPDLRILIHVSGYRVGAHQPRYPLPDPEATALYRDKGAYEGSKIEADAAVRVVAAQLGVPLAVVNPSGVIGHSTTGEAGQYIGPAEIVRDLWAGRLPALPGTARTFVPVVTVDHLARFIAAIEEPGGPHWVLDENTPELPDLIRLLAGHLGVPAPRLRVPVGVVRHLPTALTGANREVLGFLSEDRYDTASAEKLAEVAELAHPPVEIALRRWADRLVADRFGAPSTSLPGGFHEVAGSRTYLAGDRTSPELVMLHGLPLDGESWQGLLGRIGASVLVPDLPGLGRSAPTSATALDWLTDLLAPLRSRPTLVAHSAAAGPALRYAATHPDRVDALVLISPYFLQGTPSRSLRTGPLLRRMSADRLEVALLGAQIASDDARRAIDSAAAQLHRPGVARRTARWLRAANRPAERADLRKLLTEVQVPVHLVVGQRDPLVTDPGTATVTTVPDAGHHPHLT